MVLLKSLVLTSLTAVVAAKSAVIDLIPSNFDKVVFDGKPTLVEFFAPWCGHCKNLAPVYEDLASSLEFAKDKVQIAKVDADAEKDLGRKYGVQGFPTLKFFDGKSKDPVDYSGGRDIESLQSFITDKTGVRPRKKAEKPSAVTMLTDSSFETEIGGDKNVLVAFTAPWCGRKFDKPEPQWRDPRLSKLIRNDLLQTARSSLPHGSSSPPTSRTNPTSWLLRWTPRPRAARPWLRRRA